MSFKNLFRKVYDATSDSRSKFGKIGKFAYPFNGQYFVRDAWRKYGKRLMPARSNSAVSLVGSGSSDIYGPSGSIVGRY